MLDSVDGGLMVEASSGQIRGFLDRGVPNWRGVLYGHIERPFRPPEPVRPAGPLEANRRGAVSWQLPTQVGRSLYRVPLDELVENEDRFNRNVWSSGPRQDAPIPVLIWLHGGNRVYDSASSRIDAWHLRLGTTSSS
ncbi:carboxylesterase family protein [Frankia sp. CiP3]|uniref:carboxylesterase family protein n=1 Tax=Frankia sp. CiP3 TaxID=2880971 RepID=UPI001EF52051|nr:carboxylesterase family protein [Frankia sp. CiP3]